MSEERLAGGGMQRVMEVEDARRASRNGAEVEVEKELACTGRGRGGVSEGCEFR